MGKYVYKEEGRQSRASWSMCHLECRISGQTGLISPDIELFVVKVRVKLGSTEVFASCSVDSTVVV